MKKCYYCENEATKSDYRTLDGITSKVITCDECFGLNDEGIRNRYAEVSKAVEEIFDHSELDEIVDEAMNSFWDTVNNKIFELEEDLSNRLEQNVGVKPHDTTIERWREKYFNLIQSKTKSQL
jgi:hypothetical protein